MITYTNSDGSTLVKLQVAVVMACHNRINSTLNCLHSLFTYAPDHWDLTIYLVDDGSTDGTSEAISQQFPEVRIIFGPGNWYWAQSMYRAELSIDDYFDAVLWLNDDVSLLPHGLQQLEELREQQNNSVLVGQLSNYSQNQISYGGYVRVGRNPLKVKRVWAKNHPQEIDTFNGNLVLFPRETRTRVGSLDGGFLHGYADLAYGYDLKKAGFKLIAVPGFQGVCELPPTPTSSQNPFIAVRQLLSRKASPIRSQFRFLRRYGYRGWPLYLLSPYINCFFREIALKFRR